jgi:hydroxyacylglutathione hydrolase
MLDRPYPGIRSLLAPNPSPMTGPGTNGYIVGQGMVAIVDPGPDDDRHLAAWLDALAGEEVSHVLVTHAHRDHSGLATRLATAVGAPVVGFGPWNAGRSDTMQRLAGLPGVEGGEGVDRTFRPDLAVGDGDAIAGPDWRIEVVHTPGHFAGHLAFAVGDLAFTGDHALGWTSTLISPPDGDLRQFLASCRRLDGLGFRALLPGHGVPIVEPSARLDWLVMHRLERERQVLGVLSAGASRIDDIVRRLYADTPPPLWPAAARNVLAHLIALCEDGRAAAEPEVGIGATYHLT